MVGVERRKARVVDSTALQSGFAWLPATYLTVLVAYLRYSYDRLKRLVNVDWVSYLTDYQVLCTLRKCERFTHVYQYSLCTGVQSVAFGNATMSGKSLTYTVSLVPISTTRTASTGRAPDSKATNFSSAVKHAPGCNGLHEYTCQQGLFKAKIDHRDLPNP